MWLTAFCILGVQSVVAFYIGSVVAQVYGNDMGIIFGISYMILTPIEFYIGWQLGGPVKRK